MSKAKKPVADEMADQVLESIEDEFGEVGSAANRAIIRDAITRGLIEFNEGAGTLSYTLQKPVELNNGESVSVLTFEEPTVAQIERMNKGIETKGKSDGSFVISGDAQTKMTTRMVSIVAGVPIGSVEKFKRRDFQVLQALQDFFA